MAIPSWKVFAYGGLEGPLDDSKDRQGIPYGNVSVLDAGLNRWSYPEVGGDDQPKPRGDTVLAMIASHLNSSSLVGGRMSGLVTYSRSMSLTLLVRRMQLWTFILALGL